MAVDAVVESDGDMQVVQTAQYDFETEGNGFYIDFDFTLDGVVCLLYTSPGHWLAQQYLPDSLRDRVYYRFGDNKNEQAYKAYWDKIKGEE